MFSEYSAGNLSTIVIQSCHTRSGVVKAGYAPRMVRMDTADTLLCGRVASRRLWTVEEAVSAGPPRLLHSPLPQLVWVGTGVFTPGGGWRPFSFCDFAAVQFLWLFLNCCIIWPVYDCGCTYKFWTSKLLK